MYIFVSQSRRRMRVMRSMPARTTLEEAGRYIYIYIYIYYIYVSRYRNISILQDMSGHDAILMGLVLMRRALLCWAPMGQGLMAGPSWAQVGPYGPAPYGPGTHGPGPYVVADYDFAALD